MLPVAYDEKFLDIKQHTLFDTLDAARQEAIRDIAVINRLTRQELKQIVDAAIDLEMWDEKDLVARWQEWRQTSRLQGREFKKWALRQLADQLAALRNSITTYNEQQQTDARRIFGMCPVQSEKTLCCNLRTIDAVQNCGFGCSYCSIQTMYTGPDISFDQNFRRKLEAIELDSDRHYHIGTGQSSDALMWGNQHNILKDMLWFTRKWPKALIEFKAKSKNVDYLLHTDAPRNIVCSWSLNPDIIIRNEEHLTASLSERLAAARAVADRNIRIGFHLHPMLHYQGWEQNYSELIALILNRFRPEEIVFISFGALTFPRPILNKLRTYGIKSKINQTPMTTNPEDKLTYPDPIKTQLFRHAYNAFAAWHQRVFFYLCMEEARFWDQSFGYRYPDNATMEAALIQSAWSKLPATA
ncbi:MAG: hypothetical protein HW386_1559 [Gammaproteobacteria bacterium]|nr:hypothetical protein [Gammaproteobacteria bacterium]